MCVPLTLILRAGDGWRVTVVLRSEKGQIRPLPKGAGFPSNGMFGSYSFPKLESKTKEIRYRIT